MDIVAFLVLSFCNLVAIFWIIRRQGMNSAEGYCAAFIFMAVLTDNLKLLYDYFFQPGIMPLGADEFSFRFYPTIVHLIGMLVLMAGLFLGNPTPEPVSREFSDVDLDFIAYTGVALLVFGLILTGFAMHFTGAYGNRSGYFDALDTLRVGGNPGKMGGFWLRGADLAVFGACLMQAGWGRIGLRFVLSLLAMMAAAFFLKANKGGFETALVWAAVVLYTYNSRRFWSLAKPRIILVTAFVALLGIGLKVEVRGRGKSPITWEATTKNALGSIQTRWGDQALYRGYCQFVNLMPKYHYLFDNYRMGSYALTEAWIPRFLYSSKRKHPMEGLGYLIHADAHVFKQEDPSVELVGSVYADNGFYTLIPYLLIAGFLLGVLRRYAAGPHSPLQWHIPYIAFVVFAGFSPEGGIIGMIYIFIFTFSVTALAHLVVLGLFKRKLHGGRSALPAAPAPLWKPVTKFES